MMLQKAPAAQITCRDDQQQHCMQFLQLEAHLKAQRHTSHPSARPGFPATSCKWSTYTRLRSSCEPKAMPMIPVMHLEGTPAITHSGSKGGSCSAAPQQGQIHATGQDTCSRYSRSLNVSTICCRRITWMCATTSILAPKIVTVCQEGSLPRHACPAPEDVPDLHEHQQFDKTSSAKAFH